MKYLVIIIVIIAVVAAGSYWVVNRSANTSPSPTPTASTSTSDGFCQPSQLASTIDPEVAAGNYYGVIKITNTSDRDCQVVGNNQLEIGYPNSVTNFKTQVKKAPTTELFNLTPNQSIYALIHFPNGPQCSSQAVDVNAMVSYQISPTETVTFQPTQGETVDIPSCGKATDITMIDLYGFENQQVMPN